MNQSSAAVPPGSSRLQRVGSRLVPSLLGAMLAAVGAAALDARWAVTTEESGASAGATFLCVLGLLAPAASAIGVLLAGVSLWLHPEAPPSLQRLRTVLLGPVGADRARLAAWLLVMPLLVALGVTMAGQIALGVLANNGAARASGALLALWSCGVSVGLGVITVGVGRGLGERWRQRPPSPLVTLGLGLVLAVGLLAIAVATGSPGGGSGLEMFGVLRRAELDLRAPGLLLLVAGGGYVLPGLWPRRWLIVGLVCALLPLALLRFAMVGGLDDRKVALAIERDAPLARILLRPWRRLTDRDGDGAARYFGGGDCNDASAAIHPAADDLPANGIDEDCSGSDAQPVKLDAAPETPPDAATFIERALPRNLNVVFLTIDALRWDTVGFMGYPKRTTPRLDELAERGVVFERAYALASYTSKSIPPMLIGKYASETDRGWSHFNQISAKDITIEQRLQRAGIRTMSAQGYWYFYKESHGFQRGWDVLDASAAPAVMQIDGDKGVTSDKLADATIALLSKPENTSTPFFFWTHYVDPHSDYMRHEGFDFGSSNRDRYDGEVAFVDHHVGRVLDFIRQSPFADRTAIIISSDHGEAFGEHGLIRHGFEIWEPLVRVPLLVYVPGAKSHRVPMARSLIDIAPTILELFRLPPPSGQGLDFMSGQSLLADVLLPPLHELRERIVAIDMAAGPNNAERQGFIEWPLKLIASGGRPLGLYDLASDPEEKQDLLEDRARAERIVARYKEWRRRLKTVRAGP